MIILVLQIVFLFTKESTKINGLNILDKTFLYTAYTDDTTFFLKDTKSVCNRVNEHFRYIFEVFWTQTKSEIGIGALKKVRYYSLV